jgi:serine/threonine-protein kinase
MPVARWREALPWAIAVAAIAAAIGIAAVSVPRRAAPASLPLRVNADLGGGFVPSTPSYGGATALSPDSTLVAFVAQSLEGRRQLYIRRLSQLTATPLSGTDDADSPFFSPDGRWIGFFAAGKLKKIAVTGGTPFIVCDTPNGRGGAWGADGTIVFSPDGRNGVVLMRVSANGGTAEPLTSLEAGEIHHRWPQLLPGGKGVLFTANSTAGSDNANLVVQTLPHGPRKVVHRGGSYGRYLTSGHLAFAHQGSLFVVPFDLDRLEETGAPVRVVEGIATNSGGAQFDVSPAGTLVYQLGTNGGGGGLPMQWMDREGRVRMLRDTPMSWVSPRFSPDGTRLAVQMGGDRAGIWILDLGRDAPTRLTSDSIATNPVWTPDGRRLTFSSAVNGVTANIYWRPADGTREAQRLTDSVNTQYGASWHPSGKFLAFEERNPQTGPDLMILPMEGDDATGWKPGKPTAFVNSPNAEREPMFSPDGKWIAYWSNDSGRYEIYVRAFGGSGGVWQISTDGGEHPAWSPTTHELFFSLDGHIMSASYVVEGDSFRAEKPRRVADTRFAQRAQNRMFDIHPRGDRFMLAVETNTGSSGEQKAVFVFDFFNELRQIAPVSR